MTERATVLVTGAASYWGARVTARLMVEPRYRVLGLDTQHPETQVPGLDLILADLRNPLLSKLLQAEGVDAVCHLAFESSRRPSEPAFDRNVLGTTALLGACAEAGVGKIVLKSSMAVYGARVTNPAFLTEDRELRGGQAHGSIRDLIEIEVLCNGFRHREPSPLLTSLRFASIIGPKADTPMARFLRHPRAPSLLGFDPMMQVIHEHDVVEALAHAVARDRPGIYNIAAEGVLPLSKIRRLVGKPSLPVFHKFAYWGVRLQQLTGLELGGFLPLDPDYIRYPWVGDLGRMRQDLGFVPSYTAEETLQEFARALRLAPYRSDPARRTQDETYLRDRIDQRHRATQDQVPASTEEGGTRA